MKTGFWDVQIANGIMEATINRPEKRNAVTDAMVDEFDAILDDAEERDDIKAVVLTGNGKVFCAGHDLGNVEKMMKFLDDDAKPFELPRRLPRPWYFSKPLIAGVHGFVGPGGFEITAAADFIIAGQGTRWSFEVNRAGGTAPSGPYLILNQQLPQRVLNKLWMMGGWFAAEEALGWNFVQRVVPEDQVKTEARRWAEQCALIPYRQYSGAKQSLRRYYEIVGLATAIMAQDMKSGHGADNEAAKEYLRRGLAEGVGKATRDRDAAFDPDIARV